MIEYRELHTMPELESVVDLEIAVWGLLPRDAVPASLMHVLAPRGGVVLGAYDDARLIGMLLGLPVREDSGWILWSHMTGIHPAYQGQGIGWRLKDLQRQKALEHGYRTIGWTFDPLQRGNAHFNFHRLGQQAPLITSRYHVNFYGIMDDDINRGLPSDRIEVFWQIDQPGRTDSAVAENAPLLLDQGDGMTPVLRLASQTWHDPVYRIAIPCDLDAVRRRSADLVLAWRLALREAMQAAFAQGYAAADFVSGSAGCSYLLRRL